MNAVSDYYQIEETTTLTENLNQHYKLYLEILENISEICSNSDDYANMHYLSYKLSRKKFNSRDIEVFNNLISKYLIAVS